jgi:membrane-bound inhibitor of C-type lysozyme
MGMCLRGKREAERQYSETVTYKCIKTQAEIELNIDGTKSIKKIVLK